MNKYIISLICLLPLVVHAQEAYQVTYYDGHSSYWPDSRYTDNGDGTITDNETKLMWMQCVLGQDPKDSCSGAAARSHWSTARAIASDYDFAGHNDWRLPSIRELFSLSATDRANPAININLFPNHISSGRVWSSSASEDSNQAWVVEIASGRINEVIRAGGRYVRLVRTAD